MLRLVAILSLFLSLLVPAAGADAAGARQRARLEQAQAAFASALRWSEYEAAWQLVDPARRAADPLTDLELERYRQLQVTRYREGGNGELEDGSIMRTVEIGVINRHTQAERTMRWSEQWRWDDQAKRWWAAGLPDFWEGQ